MVRRLAEATVAALQARAGGAESPAPILVAYDPVLVRRRTGRRMVPDYAPRFIAGSFTRISLSAGFIRREPVPCLYRRVNSGAQGRRRDGPRNEPAGTGSDALVREGNGGEIASSVPAEIRVQTGHSGTWIASSVPAEARVQIGHGGTWIASSVPAEVRAQNGHSGTWTATSVPTEARVQTGHSGTWIAMSVPAEAGVQTGHGGIWIGMSVPAEIRARAQSAYKEAYTRAYRAYLGASPAAGDPTATPRAAGGSSRDCNYPCPLIFPTDTPQPADTCCSCPAPSPCDSCGCDTGPFACRCREFPYVVFEPLREEFVDEDCTCVDGNCICTGRKCRATLVPKQRYGHACFRSLYTETLVFYEKSAECKDCTTDNCLRYCNHCPGDTGTCTDNPYGWDILWVVDKRFSEPCTVSPVLCECS
jgi:hypothetical protein